MQKKRVASCVVVFLVTLAACAIAARGFASPPNWTSQPLATNADNTFWPSVSGDRVAWTALDAGFDQVCTWKAGSSVTTLTSGALNHFAPQVSVDRMMWQDRPVYEEIYTWTPESGVTTITSGDPNHQDPQVSGDRVVWMAADASNSQVVTWKAGSGITTLTSGSPNHVDPGVSGDRVVWADWSGAVYTWTPSASATRLAINVDFDYPPQLSGDRVVWVGWDGSHLQVCTWTPESGVATLTSGSPDHWSPQVSGDRVAWTDSSSAVFTWTPGSGVATLATNADSLAQVSGDRVVWEGWDGHNDQVCTWRTGDSSVTTLTGGSPDHFLPVVSGDRVAWLEGSGNPVSVETALFIPTPTSVSKPGVSPKSPKHGKTASFSASLSPANAVGTARLVLSEQQTKTVRVKRRGKWRKVKVEYWRQRAKITMTNSSGHLTAKAKLKYKGSWKAQVLFASSHDFAPSTSAARTFKAR